MSKTRDKVLITCGVIRDTGELETLRFSVELRGSAILRNEYPDSGTKGVDTRYVGFLVPKDFKRSLAVQSTCGETVFEIAGVGDGLFPHELGKAGVNDHSTCVLHEGLVEALGYTILGR